MMRAWLVTVVCLLTACGGDDDTSDDGADSTPTTTVASSESSGSGVSTGSPTGMGSGDGTSAATGAVCVDFGELCFDDFMGEAPQFEAACCEPTAQCSMACTNSDPSHCTGTCQPGRG